MRVEVRAAIGFYTFPPSACSDTGGWPVNKISPQCVQDTITAAALGGRCPLVEGKLLSKSKGGEIVVVEEWRDE